MAAITLIAHIHWVTILNFALPFILAGLPFRAVLLHFVCFAACCAGLILTSPFVKAAKGTGAQSALPSPKARRREVTIPVNAIFQVRGSRTALFVTALAAPALGCAVVVRAALFAVAAGAAVHAPGTNGHSHAETMPMSGVLAGILANWHLTEVRAAVAWVCGSAVHYAYVAATYPGSPEISGSRDACGASPRLPRIAALMARISAETARYFQGRVVLTGDPLGPRAERANGQSGPTAGTAQGGPYIFGFHPHGVLPLTTLWLRLSPQWRAVAPDFNLLTASVVHFIPVMRDLMQWLGSREVSRASIGKALAEGRSVMLVPGGQAEMLESRSGARRLRLVAKNRGLMRVAIEHGVPLVPVLSFGETELMDNVHLPLIQKWFVRHFGMPPLHLPYGVLGLPVPRPHPVTVCVGAPVHPPVLAPGQELSAELVDALHRDYYTAVKKLFHERKAEAGFPDLELELLG